MEKKRLKGITIVAVFIVLYSLYTFLGNGISPGGSKLAEWVSILSIISAVGIWRLKKWAWYCGILFIVLNILFYLWGMRNLLLLQDYFFSIIFLTAWPLVCVIYLILPKVREQFK